MLDVTRGFVSQAKHAYGMRRTAGLTLKCAPCSQQPARGRACPPCRSDGLDANSVLCVTGICTLVEGIVLWATGWISHNHWSTTWGDTVRATLKMPAFSFTVVYRQAHCQGRLIFDPDRRGKLTHPVRYRQLLITLVS
jgi:hypothetical protein